MRRRLSLLLFSLFLASQQAMAADTGPRLVSEDLARFWHAHDLAAAEPDPERRAAIWQAEYLDRGSEGLRAFTRLRIGDGGKLAAAVDAAPAYYASLRWQPERLAKMEPEIHEAVASLSRLLPWAEIPDVHFLIGRMNSGGTLDDVGLLIGLEMFGRENGTPEHELGDWHRQVLRGMDGLPAIVVHELVHYQQQWSFEGQPTLLQAALNEGVADFVTELAIGRHINGHVHAWAEPRAAELWREFLARKDGSDYAGWLYDGGVGDRPADLGYWMGYRIARAYYERAGDKAQSLRDMLAIGDAEAFLEASGLAGEFARP
ncbi:MAG TPA: DUF2268 domain-containing putative Zn-dependent protease [Arenimonas sp.]|nr:DUF2268 domain-containing putative Zn-dependent protease [Arenimonas sp.]